MKGKRVCVQQHEQQYDIVGKQKITSEKPAGAMLKIITVNDNF